MSSQDQAHLPYCFSRVFIAASTLLRFREKQRMPHRVRTMARVALLMSACFAGAAPALAQTTPFSTYVLGLATVGSVTGAEKLVGVSGGVPKTLTPNQILSNMNGDCTMVSPPSIVCTKINGLTLAASATTDTTNASNISSGTLPLGRLALASASIYVGNVSNVPAAAVVSGDCTITNAGVITCPKTGGVTFAASATTDTTNATNISSGTLAGARQSAANLAASGNGGVTGVLPFANDPTGSLDTVLGYWSSTTQSATAVPNCTTGALQYSTTTHAWTCNTGAGSGNVSNSGTPTNGQIAQWVSATAIKGANISALSVVGVVKQQTFTSSGTYTPSAGLQHAIVECVGGGAGGGGSGDAGAGNSVAAGGGGSGGYSKHVATAAAIGGSQVVTIGNAGSGGNSVGSAGGNGGNTSVGSLCTANGGVGGGGAVSSSFGSGGVGGSAGSGNMVAIAGADGGAGQYQTASTFSVTIVAPSGGSSFYGPGGGAQPISGASLTGKIAKGFGGGGGGSGNGNGSGGNGGGNGTPGYVLVTEFTNQ